MGKKIRRDIKTTFEFLMKILSQTNSTEVSTKSSQVLNDLLEKSARYSRMVGAECLEIRSDVDVPLDMENAVAAIRAFLFDEDNGIEDREELLNKARERIRKVNDDLKGWAD